MQTTWKACSIGVQSSSVLGTLEKISPKKPGGISPTALPPKSGLAKIPHLRPQDHALGLREIVVVVMDPDPQLRQLLFLVVQHFLFFHQPALRTCLDAAGGRGGGRHSRRETARTLSDGFGAIARR